MSQAQCTAEVEAWLVRNNFTEPQRAHLLQQVDALSDFSEAVDEDIPAITAGWSSLARSKLRRCVAKLCAERGWECKLAPAPAPAPAPAHHRGITPAPPPPPQRPSPPRAGRPKSRGRNARPATPRSRGSSPRPRAAARAQPPKKRPAAKPAPRPKKKAKPPAQPDDDATAGDAELARRLSGPARAECERRGLDGRVGRAGGGALEPPAEQRRRRAPPAHRGPRPLQDSAPPRRASSSRRQTRSRAPRRARQKIEKTRDAYMGATTVGEFLSCGGRPADRHDVERGYCEVTDARWAARWRRRPRTMKPRGRRRGAAARRALGRALRRGLLGARGRRLVARRRHGPGGDRRGRGGARAREQGQRYAVYNFGVDSAEQFSFAAPQNLVGWAEACPRHGAPGAASTGGCCPRPWPRPRRS